MLCGGEDPVKISVPGTHQTHFLQNPNRGPIELERSTDEILAELRDQNPNEFVLVPVEKLRSGTTLVPWGPYQMSGVEPVTLDFSDREAPKDIPFKTCFPPARVFVEPQTLREYAANVFGGAGILHGGKYFGVGLVRAVDEVLPLDEATDTLFGNPYVNGSARVVEGATIILLAVLLVKAAPVAGTGLMILGIAMGPVYFLEGYVDAQSWDPEIQQRGIALGQEGVFTSLFAGGLLASVRTAKGFAALQLARGEKGGETLARAASVLCAIDDPLHAKNAFRAVWNQALH